MRRVRQEIHCHNCDQYVQFRIDMALNGNHVIVCPNCKHEHCRVVKDGRITDIRWDTRNGRTYQVAATTTSYSTATTFSATISNIRWTTVTYA